MSVTVYDEFIFSAMTIQWLSTQTTNMMVDVVSLLCLILVINLTLVGVFWRIYGPRIHVLIAKKGEKDQILGWLICFSIIN